MTRQVAIDAGVPSVRVLNWVWRRHDCENDAALAAVLNVARPVVSRIKTGKCGIGYSLLVTMHEITGVPTQEIRKVADGTSSAFR